MQPAAWIEAWEHGVVNAHSDDRSLPVDARAFLLSHGLPRVVIFEWRCSFEISFSPLGKELVSYGSEVRWGDFYNEVLDKEWRDQLIIGEEEFCNGHASFCVHKRQGTVSRIDCELPIPQSFVNSSVAQFGMSLLVAKRWSANLSSRGLAPSRDSLKALARELKKVDVQAFETDEHFWRSLIEYVLDDEPTEFEITNDPARSKPRF